jgi:hypothetical protein
LPRRQLPPRQILVGAGIPGGIVQITDWFNDFWHLFYYFWILEDIRADR